MTFAEIVCQVAKDTKRPKRQVARVLRSFFNATRDAVLSDRKVRLREFGVFYSVRTKPGALFGGTRTALDKKIIRFKESRYGKAGSRGR